MRSRSACFTFLLVCSLAVPRLTAAQVDETGPKIGLALSGGGARGFAHVGVLKVIEEAGITIDLVTGTSIGAAVGGIYASGYSADSLKKLALEEDWEELFRESARRRSQGGARPLRDEKFIVSLPLAGTRIKLPAGLISGQMFSMKLFRLTIPVHDVRDFRKLPIPFGATVVDLETGESVLLDHGYLPIAIRASIAIPSVFTPVEIDGRLYTDGSVMRVLPAEEARVMGADLLVCVDTSVPVEPLEKLDSFTDYLLQSIGFHIRGQLEEQKALCDLVIEPDVGDYSFLDFSDVPGLIERGEEAARKALPELRSLAGVRGRRARPYGFEPEPARDLLLREVRVAGLTPRLERQVRSALDIDPPVRISVKRMESAIMRVYDTDLFDQVNYRLDGGEVLVLEAQPTGRRSLGVGLRHESDLKTTALFSASFGNQLSLGPRTELNIRLGENVRAEAVYTKPLRYRWRIWGKAVGQVSWSSIDLVGAGGETIARRRVQVSEAHLIAGRSFSNSATMSAGVHAEHHETGDAIGTDQLPRGPGNLIGLTARIRAGEIDEARISDGGRRILITSDLATTGSEPFLLSTFDAQVRQSVSASLSLLGKIAVGHITGGEPPLHYRFYAGGTFAALPFDVRQISLLGYDLQSFSGRTMQVYALGLQYRLPRESFVQLIGNAGRLHGDYGSLQDTDGFRFGFGLILGTQTLVGPIMVGFVAPDPDGPFEMAISVGASF